MLVHHVKSRGADTFGQSAAGPSTHKGACRSPCANPDQRAGRSSERTNERAHSLANPSPGESTHRAYAAFANILQKPNAARNFLKLK